MKQKFTVTSMTCSAHVDKAGYGAAAQARLAAGAMEEELRSMKLRLIVSFVFLIPLFYISMGHMKGRF